MDPSSSPQYTTRFEAEGDFGYFTLIQHNIDQGEFHVVKLKSNLEVQFDLSLSPSELSIMYCYHGYCLYQHSSKHDVIVQTQVKAINSDNAKIYMFSIPPTEGGEYGFLILSVLLSHSQNGNADLIQNIKSALRISDPVYGNCKPFLSSIDVQLSATSIFHQLAESETNIITTLKSHFSILLLAVLIHLDVTAEITDTNDWNPEKREAYQMAEEIILAMDEPWPIKKLAGSHHVNSNKLKLLFKKHIGLPAAAFKIYVRMQKARQLLIETNLNIQEIAAMVGYSNPAQFSTMFKRKMGCSPNDLRKN